MLPTLQSSKQNDSRQHVQAISTESVTRRSTGAIWALVLFVAINSLLSICSAGRKLHSRAFNNIEMDMWRGRGAMVVMLEGFNSLKQRPNIVLIGSSMIMYPFWALDCLKQKSIADIFHHRRSFALEEALSERGLHNECVYSLSLFGQMISDTHMIINELLKDDKSPEWLVWGISPREFCDFDVHEVTSTIAFRSLVNLSNFGVYAPMFLPTWQSKADFLLTHLCFFYEKRWQMQKSISGQLSKIYDVLWPRTNAISSVSPQLTEHVGFTMNGSSKERWASSFKEYQRRYSGFDEKSISLQFRFLEQTLALCRKRGIKVVLINMPLTKENRSILPIGFYRSFTDRVSATAGRLNASFLDLGNSGQFDDKSDFWDTAHLNHFGGAKLIQKLIPILVVANKNSRDRSSSVVQRSVISSH